ncbi:MULTISPECIES: metal ABC transporter permease [Corynebacterium]|nr:MULTISPECIES: metal ABC transporter permease [Corynebacterium]
MTALIDMLSYPFMHNALIVAVAMAIAAGLVSCLLIMVGWSLLGDAISHALLPGVVVAYIAGLPYAVGAFVASLIAVGVVNGLKTRTTLREDTTIGIVFTAFFALGLVLISRTPGTGHLEEILFGNLLGISESVKWQVVGFGAAAVALILFGRRALRMWAFDPLHAAMAGFPVRVVRWILLTALVFVVVSAAQAVGAILVVAMLVTPGATAYLLTRRFGVMLVLAPSIAVVCSVAGLLGSVGLNVSPGGGIILLQFMVFILVWLFAPREGVLVRRIGARGKALKGTTPRAAKTEEAPQA